MPGFSVQLYAVDFQDKGARNIRDLKDEDNSCGWGQGHEVFFAYYMTFRHTYEAVAK